MKKIIILLIAALLTLSACAPAELPPNTEPSGTIQTDAASQPTDDSQPAIPPTQPAAPVYVSEHAVEDFLLPIEEFSWERQHAPEFVMIHFTSAVANHPDDPYNMDHIRDIFVQYDISVHYIVDRDGTVHCYIPEDRVAWHAGAGTFLDDPKYTNAMNQYAIGIEVAAMGSQEEMSIYLTKQQYQALDDSLKGFTQAQYDALKLLVADLCARYEIPADRDHVIGHDEYSSKKNDPGSLFDWSQILP